MKSSLTAAMLGGIAFAKRPTTDAVALLRRLQAEWRTFFAMQPKNTELLDWLLFVPHG
jgi:hypothetical protein